MEGVVEKQVCVHCGADVREGTQFCYSCGKSVIAEDGDPIDAETPAIDPLDPAFATSAPVVGAGGDRSRAAAAERKKARSARYKAKETEWVEPSDGANILFVVASLAIFVLAAVVVAIMFLLR